LAYVTRVRPEKQAIVEQLREWIDQSKGMVFFSFEGLTSKDMQAMRADMKRNGLTVKVVKNTLLELAVKEVGLNVDESLFRGTTALLFSNEDELAPFKLFIEQVKKYGVLQAKGGILEGRWISAKEVDAIAKLPGRQELCTVGRSSFFTNEGIGNSVVRSLQKLGLCIASNKREERKSCIKEVTYR